MNPPRDRRGRRTSLHLYLLGAIAIAVAMLAISEIGVPASSARTETETVAASDGVVQTTVTGSGNVEPSTDDEVDFETSGTLKHVDVEVGEHVREGQILAALDPTSAELTLNEAEVDLTEARDNLKAARDGDTTSSSSSGSSSNGSVENARREPASATTSTTTARRPTTTTTSAPTSSTSTPTKTVTITVTTPSKTVTTTTPTQTTTVPQTTIESDKLAVESAEQTVTADKAALAETTLRAPASGTVESIEDTTPGASISSGGETSSGSSSDSSSSSSASGSSGSVAAGSLGGSSSSSSSSGFIEIINAHTLTMTVAFSESDIGEVKVGQAATVSIDALSGVELGARVTAISPTPTESDSVVSYDVTLTLEQTDSEVKAGMSASAAVIVKQAQGVTVPNDAISGSGNEGSVTVEADGKREQRQVVVGLRGSTRSVIASGLSAGAELVITTTLPSLETSTTSSSSSSSSSGTLGGSGFGGTGAAGGFAGRAGAGGPP